MQLVDQKAIKSNDHKGHVWGLNQADINGVLIDGSVSHPHTFGALIHIHAHTTFRPRIDDICWRTLDTPFRVSVAKTRRQFEMPCARSIFRHTVIQCRVCVCGVSSPKVRARLILLSRSHIVYCSLSRSELVADRPTSNIFG